MGHKRERPYWVGFTLKGELALDMGALSKASLEG